MVFAPTNSGEVNANINCSPQGCQDKGRPWWKSHRSVSCHEVLSQQHGHQMDRYIHSQGLSKFGDPLSKQCMTAVTRRNCTNKGTGTGNAEVTHRERNPNSNLQAVELEVSKSLGVLPRVAKCAQDFKQGEIVDQ